MNNMTQKQKTSNCILWEMMYLLMHFLQAQEDFILIHITGSSTLSVFLADLGTLSISAVLAEQQKFWLF